MGYFEELRPLVGHHPLLMVSAATLSVDSVFILFICG
jgi:hypothetical protein